MFKKDNFTFQDAKDIVTGVAALIKQYVKIISEFIGNLKGSDTEVLDALEELQESI